MTLVIGWAVKKASGRPGRTWDRRMGRATIINWFNWFGVDRVGQKSNLLKEGKINVNKNKIKGNCTDQWGLVRTKQNEKETVDILQSLRASQEIFSWFRAHVQTHSQDVGLMWLRCKFLRSSIKPLFQRIFCPYKEGRTSRLLQCCQQLIPRDKGRELRRITRWSSWGPTVLQLLLHLLSVLGKN